MTTVDPVGESRDLLEFIDSSPSPFHACFEVARRLEGAGFRCLQEEEAWSRGPGRWYVVRDGSLSAWALEEGEPPQKGLRVLAAHTDSPTLRVKPRPDTGRAGWRQLGVEVYGSPLLNSWLDRDLGLSGRAAVSGRGQVLFKVDRPILRVPQLAIHLDREIITGGLQLDKQRHMSPVWAVGPVEEGGFARFLAEELCVEPESLLAWDAICHDTAPSQLVGRDGDLISAPRLDNLASCFAALRALLDRIERPGEREAIPAICLFDHEEVGSGSNRGAGSPLLADLFERTVIARGGGREELARCLAASACVSADMAHATHPNYADRHEPDHPIEMNGGPVIKINANMRYATDSTTESMFVEACREAGAPVQKYVNRSDLPCGSTIGPITAARLGLRTLDVGNPMLGMHSARELAGALDTGHMIRALAAFLR